MLSVDMHNANDTNDDEYDDFNAGADDHNISDNESAAGSWE